MVCYLSGRAFTQFTRHLIASRSACNHAPAGGARSLISEFKSLSVPATLPSRNRLPEAFGSWTIPSVQANSHVMDRLKEYEPGHARTKERLALMRSATDFKLTLSAIVAASMVNSAEWAEEHIEEIIDALLHLSGVAGQFPVSDRSFFVSAVESAWFSSIASVTRKINRCKSAQSIVTTFSYHFDIGCKALMCWSMHCRRDGFQVLIDTSVFGHVWCGDEHWARSSDFWTPEEVRQQLLHYVRYRSLQGLPDLGLANAAVSLLFDYEADRGRSKLGLREEPKLAITCDTFFDPWAH